MQVVVVSVMAYACLIGVTNKECGKDHNGVCVVTQPSVPSRRTLTLHEKGLSGWTAQDATHQLVLAGGRHTNVSQEASSCSHHTEWKS